MAVVNKLHKQDQHYTTLHCPTYNHPYIDSCSRYLRLAATYVVMVTSRVHEGERQYTVCINGVCQIRRHGVYDEYYLRSTW